MSGFRDAVAWAVMWAIFTLALLHMLAQVA